MQDVARQTDDALQLGPGTLYGCLKRMLAAGLVEESDERPDPALDDERRRYYRMTALGQARGSRRSAAPHRRGDGSQDQAGWRVSHDAPIRNDRQLLPPVLRPSLRLSARLSPAIWRRHAAGLPRPLPRPGAHGQPHGPAALRHPSHRRLAHHLGPRKSRQPSGPPPANRLPAVSSRSGRSPSASTSSSPPRWCRPT